MPDIKKTRENICPDCGVELEPGPSIDGVWRKIKGSTSYHKCIGGGLCTTRHSPADSREITTRTLTVDDLKINVFGTAKNRVPYIAEFMDFPTGRELHITLLMGK